MRSALLVRPSRVQWGPNELDMDMDMDWLVDS